MFWCVRVYLGDVPRNSRAPCGRIRREAWVGRGLWRCTGAQGVARAWLLWLWPGPQALLDPHLCVLPWRNPALRPYP